VKLEIVHVVAVIDYSFRVFRLQ